MILPPFFELLQCEQQQKLFDFFSRPNLGKLGSEKTNATAPRMPGKEGKCHENWEGEKLSLTQGDFVKHLN